MKRLMRVSFFSSLLRLLLLAMMCAVLAGAQEQRPRSVNAAVASQTNRSLDPTFIPAGAKVFVNEIDGYEGFENYLVAAFKKKKVRLLVVTDRSQADFEISGYSESQKAGWAKIIFGSGRPEEEASIQVVNLRTSVVAYAVASYKTDAWNGKKSTAEHLAKNLRQKMERDLRK